MQKMFRTCLLVAVIYTTAAYADEMSNMQNMTPQQKEMMMDKLRSQQKQIEQKEQQIQAQEADMPHTFVGRRQERRKERQLQNEMQQLQQKSMDIQQKEQMLGH